MQSSVKLCLGFDAVYSDPAAAGPCRLPEMMVANCEHSLITIKLKRLFIIVNMSYLGFPEFHRKLLIKIKIFVSIVAVLDRKLMLNQ